MDSPQNIKKRLKSVANIKKITKAMELAAATKMRKSQEIALASRPYAFVALDLLAKISLLERKQLPELLLQRKIKKVLFVLVASDKGLAGAFNSALFKRFEKYIQWHRETYRNEEEIFAAVGEKSFQYLSRKKATVVRKFTNIGDFTTTGQIHPIADFIIEGYLGKAFDRVVVFSTHFQSALKQEALVQRVLPVDFDHIRETVEETIPKTGKFADLVKESEMQFVSKKEAVEYLIEPSPEKVLENLARHLLFMQVYHLVLEANASEHSARRMAMKTASDNASDLGEALNLEYNKSRQAGITNQIIEITAGSESLN